MCAWCWSLNVKSINFSSVEFAFFGRLGDRRWRHGKIKFLRIFVEIVNLIFLGKFWEIKKEFFLRHFQLPPPIAAITNTANIKSLRKAIITQHKEVNFLRRIKRLNTREILILLFESLSSEYLNLLRFRRIQEEEEDAKKENQLLAINSTPPSLVLIKEKKKDTNRKCW